jgi:hypothetical protein
MRAPTTEEEQILDQASSIDEMKQSQGWKLFVESMGKALAAIDQEKARIPRTDWSQDPKTAEVRSWPLKPDEIGLRYIVLDERADAIRFILAQVDSFGKKSEQLRKKLETEPS